MARRQTKTKTNSRRGKKNFDPIAVAGAVGTGAYVLDLAKKHVMPSQGTVNRFVRGENPSVRRFYLMQDGREPLKFYVKASGGEQTPNRRYVEEARDDASQIAGHSLSWQVAGRPYGTGVRAVAEVKQNPEDIDFLNDRAPFASAGHIEFTPDGIERYVRDGYVYMAFSNTPVFGDGYRMGTPEESAELYAVKNPAKYARSIHALKNPRRKNPEDAANALYENFHGEPPAEILEYHEKIHVHSHLGGLADLVHLVVEMAAGTKVGREMQLNAPDPANSPIEDIVRLTASEDGTTLYFTGGDQSLNLKVLGFRESFDVVHDGERYDATDYKDLMMIGPICRVMYRTEKDFDNFEEIDYHHLHGEDTKKYPWLVYDRINKLMLSVGGEYAISKAGIVN